MHPHPADEHRRPTLRPRSVRLRLTLVATGLVAVALLIAAAVMMAGLQQVLVRSAETAAADRAQQIATELSAGGLTGLLESGLLGDGDVGVVQILDGDGQVIFGTADRYRPAPSPAGRPGPDGRRGRDLRAEDGFRVATAEAITPAGRYTVRVGRAEAPIERTVTVVGVLCAILFPLIVAGVALLTHYLVGRSLRPVEQIRRRVDEISGGDLSQRVPESGSGDEIAVLAETMNRMLGRLETSRDRQLQFVNDASHELNSPLTTLVGLLDLADATDQPIDVDTVRTLMKPDADRLAAMVADLLLLTRADESGLGLRKTDVDLDDLVAAEAARLDAITDLTVTPTIEPARVIGDAGMLQRALRNLTDNAARYARSEITLQMATESRTVTVTVSDDGPGIPESDRERVFDRFVRLDDSRERARGGAGLGLAIVAEIVTAHDGTVRAEASGAGGAAISLTLPLEPSGTDD